MSERSERLAILAGDLEHHLEALSTAQRTFEESRCGLFSSITTLKEAILRDARLSEVVEAWGKVEEAQKAYDGDAQTLFTVRTTVTARLTRLRNAATEASP